MDPRSCGKSRKVTGHSERTGCGVALLRSNASQCVRVRSEQW